MTNEEAKGPSSLSLSDTPRFESHKASRCAMPIVLPSRFLPVNRCASPAVRTEGVLAKGRKLIEQPAGIRRREGVAAARDQPKLGRLQQDAYLISEDALDDVQAREHRGGGRVAILLLKRGVGDQRTEDL